MGYSYSFRPTNHFVVFVSNLSNSLMFNENIDYLYYWNNGKFYKNFNKFLKDKEKISKISEVFFLFNALEEEGIDRDIENFLIKNKNWVKISEYEYVWPCLSGNRFFKSRLGGYNEKRIKNTTEDTKISHYISLQSLFKLNIEINYEETKLGLKRKFSEIEDDINLENSFSKIYYVYYIGVN